MQATYFFFGGQNQNPVIYKMQVTYQTYTKKIKL